MEYLVIFEECNDGGYSAYVPDLPVCFTVGDTLEDTKENIKDKRGNRTLSGRFERNM